MRCFGQLDTSTIALIWSGLVAVVVGAGAVIAWFIPKWKEWSQVRRENILASVQMQASAFDVLKKEYKELLERAEEDRVRDRTTIDQQGTKINELTDRVQALMLREALCTQRTEFLEQQVSTLKEEMHRLLEELSRRGIKIPVRVPLPTASIVADREGKVVSWDEGARMLLGWTKDQALGRNVEDFMPESFRPYHRKSFQEVLAGRPLRFGPYHAVALMRDGRTVPVEIVLSNVRGSTGVQFFRAVLTQRVLPIEESGGNRSGDNVPIVSSERERE